MAARRLFADSSRDPGGSRSAGAVPGPVSVLALSGLCGLLLAAPVAHAGVVGVRYSGYVYYLDNAAAGFPIPVAINDAFELTVLFDNTVADSLPADTANGRYENAITEWSARIGDQTIAYPSEQNWVIQDFGNLIAVTNNAPIPTYGSQVGDAYQIGTSAFMPGGIRVHGSLSLRNSGYPPTNPLSSDALLNGPVDPGLWGNRDLALSFWDPQAGGRTIFAYATGSELLPGPPDAADDGPIPVTEGIATVIPVGSNDINFDDPVSVIVTSLPTKGTITAVSEPGPAAGMTITYVANAGAVGPDTFVYEMTDIIPEADSATVRVSISPEPDTTPDAFTFTDQSGVALEALITSDPVTITGINVPTGIAVVGGEYSINGGYFTTVDGVVSDGDSVSVRQISSGSSLESTDVTLTIGDVADTFTVTTAEDSDDDGVVDWADNCKAVWNATQCDSDADGFGNRCDGDLNNNGITNAQDNALFRQERGLPSDSPIYNQADINCSGAVNGQDAILFRQLLGAPPGPSGLH